MANLPASEVGTESNVGGGHEHLTHGRLAQDPILTVDELALLLRVNRKTLYSAIQRGEIPGVRRIGGVIRIARAAVLAWMDQGQGRAVHSRRSR